MKLPEEEPKKGAPEWVVTYGDMMSLLLCFFIMLLAFSTLETERFKVLAGFIRDAFGVQTEKNLTEIPSGTTPIHTASEAAAYSKAQIFEKIQQLVKDLKSNGEIEVSLDADGVRVRVEGGLLFASGSATLDQEFTPFLVNLGRIARESAASVTVEGHTDNVPIASPVFPSNWELSGARAGAVVRFLEVQGIPGGRLEAVGYGEARPIADNAEQAGRRKNRRVEIKVKTTGDSPEGF